MHFKFVCRIILVLSASILILYSEYIDAQTPTLPVSTVSSTTGIKTVGDFSLSIEPTSVMKLSDDQLNELFDKMAAHYSRNAVLFNNIGASYFERKMYDKAETALRRAVVLNNHPAFLTNLSIVYETTKRVPEAIATAQRAVTQSPRYTRGRVQLCELMVSVRRNSDALICYDELAKFAPLDTLGQTLYALSYLRLGNSDRAISIVSPLVRAGEPTPLMYNILGHAYYQKKRFQQATDAFKQGVELDPDSPNLRFNLAMALTASDNRIGALSQYKFVKDQNPEMADKLYRYLYRDKLIYVDDATASKKP
jgi:tetratricopeptide (TPR) repeat protein